MWEEPHEPDEFQSLAGLGFYPVEAPHRGGSRVVSDVSAGGTFVVRRGPAAVFQAAVQHATKEAINPLEFRALADRVAALTGEVDQLRAEIRTRTKTALSIHELPGYRLTAPISVLVESVRDGYLATAPEFDIWIDGYSESEALEELKGALANLATDLFASRDDELGPDPRRWKRSLSRIAAPE